MNQRTSGVLLVAFSALLWGSSFPAIKLALGGAGDEVSFSFVVSFVRLAIAAVLGLAVMLALRRMEWRIFCEPVVWLLGVLNAISFGAQHMGLAYTTPSKTALLVNFNVVFVAVLSYFFFRERLGLTKATGVALGMGGVAVVATRLDPAFLSQGELSGDMLVFMAGFFWSLYTLYTKKGIDAGLDYIGLSVAVLATTAIFRAIPLPFVNLTQPVRFAGWAGIAYLGVVSTLLPLILWSRALMQMSATSSSVLMLLEVFFAVVLSIIFVGEVFLPIYILGGVMILTGGILAARTETARDHATPEGPAKE